MITVTVVLPFHIMILGVNISSSLDNPSPPAPTATEDRVDLVQQSKMEISKDFAIETSKKN